MDEKLKLAFEKVRKDIEFLGEEMKALRRDLDEIKANFTNKGSKRNEGVPTDKQTNQHINRQTTDKLSTLVDESFSPLLDFPTQTPTHNPTDVQQSNTSFQQSNTKLQHVSDFSAIVESMKTDLKKRFKSLTKQEFYIFSILFTVDKSQNSVTYKDIAAKTQLSESSIRDYIQRIAKKGIPIVKERLNNKITILKIPEEIRNLATLDNLLRLRDQIPDSSLDSFTN